MPGHDVKLKGTWSKHKIVKTMEGQIYESPKVMRAYTLNSTVDYHDSNYKSKITSVKTKLDINIPLTALEVENGNGNYWDVSEAGNESVIAYIEDDGNGGYKLTIGKDGKLIANSNSSYLFRGFSALKEIDLSYLDTTNVTDSGICFLVVVI